MAKTQGEAGRQVAGPVARCQQALEQFPVVEAGDAVAGFKLVGMAGDAELVGVGVALVAEYEAHGAGLVGGYGERPVDGVVHALCGCEYPGPRRPARTAADG